MDALLRRRIMFAAGGSPTPPTPPEPPGVDEYDQDGLVLHLDAIEKGDSAGNWTSIVNGYVFVNNGATMNQNSVEFNGTSSYLENSSFTSPAVGTGTIEICYQADGISTAQIIFRTKGSTGLCFGFSSSKIIWSAGGTNTYNKPMYTSPPLSGTVSINDSMAIANGNAMSSSGNDRWGGNPTSTYIGRGGSGSFFKGKIYSIRIYNRQLSEAEILSNYAIDLGRFNL